MGIEVNGNNNRVAGRDYYELPLKPCPRCEQRVIAPHQSICNHCAEKEREEAAKTTMAFSGVAVLFCFSWLHSWRTDHGLPPGIGGMAETFFMATIIVIVGYVLLQLLIHWIQTRNW